MREPRFALLSQRLITLRSLMYFENLSKIITNSYNQLIRLAIAVPRALIKGMLPHQWLLLATKALFEHEFVKTRTRIIWIITELNGRGGFVLIDGATFTVTGTYAQDEEDVAQFG